VARITRRFVDQHGLTVGEGPFAGMRFPRYAVGRGELVVAQLLGAYEQELQPAIARVIAGAPDQVIDIGASDGYYAVGLARACPSAVVRAWEMNPFPAKVCEALARENGVADRIVLGGECKLSDLEQISPEPRTFVLSDCEGGEDELMRPDVAPVLRSAALIVELHEFAVADIRDKIVERFSDSHEIEIIDSRRRFIGDYPALLETQGVSYIDREVGVTEFRPVQMRWAVLWPKGGW
jgi:hypothetical protein